MPVENRISGVTVLGLIKKYLVLGLAFLVAMVAGQCADKPTVPKILETTISGRVIDAETNKPISNATVNSEPATEQVLTNGEGLYVLQADVEVGKTYRVTAIATDYVQNNITLTAKEGENRIADLRLSPSLPQLQLQLSQALH